MPAGRDDLVSAIRRLSSLENLFPLAATARSLMATAAQPGDLLVGHLVLLQAKRRLEGEPMSETDWFGLRQVLDRLADLLTDEGSLDALAIAWREWTKPEALQ